MKHGGIGVHLLFCVLFFFVKDVALLPLDYLDLTEGLLADFKQAFELLDKDGDGKIAKEEFGVLIRNVLEDKVTGWSNWEIKLLPRGRVMGNGMFADSELQDMMAFADRDGNGTIDFNEFLEIVSGGVENLKNAFDIMDKNNDGLLSSSELRNTMISLGQNMTEEEAKDMIRDADADGDGMVNYEEFVDVLTKK